MTFFTRLPLWRLCNIPREYYERVIPLWPLAGWVTGGVMAAVFILARQVMNVEISVMLALAARVLLTGALHEDGFADFCDGFGGGTSRERTLEIMKDSHIGTYGVLGLVLYYIIIYNTLTYLYPTDINSIPHHSILSVAVMMLCTDTAAKMLSATIVYFLPYARKESEAKNKLVYAHVPLSEKILSVILGLLPVILVGDVSVLPAFLFALLCGMLTVTFLFRMMHRTIQGYTGDCCGATFIITELVMYLALCAFIQQ